MPRHRIYTLLFMMTVGVLAIAASGCKDSPARQAGTNIRTAVAKANRLCDSARALMEAGVAIDLATGEYAPFSRKIPVLTDPSAVKAELEQIQIPTSLPTGKPAKEFVDVKWDDPTLEGSGQKSEHMYQISEDKTGMLPNYVTAQPQIENFQDPMSDKSMSVYDEGKPNLDGGSLGVEETKDSSGNPISVPKGKYDVVITPLGPSKLVNPKALDMLKTAETELAAAVKDNEQATVEDVVIAKMAQAQVQSLIGEYHMLTTSPYAQAVRNAEYRSTKVLKAISAASRSVELLDGLINASYDAIEQMAKSEGDREKAANDSAASLAKDNDSKENTRKDLEQKIAARRVTINELRASSKLTSGVEGVNLLDKAQQLEVEVYNFQKQIDDIEAAVALQKSQIAEQKIIAGFASETATACRKMMENRDNNKKLLAEKKAVITANIAKFKQMLIGNLADCVNYAAMYNTANGLAIAGFESASAIYDEIETKVKGSQKLSLFNQSGDVRTSLGQCYLQSYTLQAEVRELAADIRQSLKSDAPEGLKDVDAIYAKIEDAKRLAEQKFILGADACKRAMDAQTKPELKWAYQGRLAAIYMSLLRVANTDTNRSEAKRLIDEALADKEYSPLLADVRSLKAFMEVPTDSSASTAQPAPTTQP